MFSQCLSRLIYDNVFFF